MHYLCPGHDITYGFHYAEFGGIRLFYSFRDLRDNVDTLSDAYDGFLIQISYRKYLK